MLETGPLSQRLLERYLAGELDEAERAQLDRRFGADEGARRQLEALRADDARLLAAVPPAQAAAEIERRLHLVRTREAVQARRRRAKLWWFAPVPVAAAAALLLLPHPAAPPGEEPVEVTRTKGLQAHLRVYLRGGPAPQLLRDGARVRPRDEVQLATVTPGRPWAAVVSVDAQGGATLHAAPAQVGPGEVRLPQAFELDESPGYERFFLVTSDTPFQAPQVLEAARALAKDPLAARSRPLPLPAAFSQSSLLLQKVTP